MAVGIVPALQFAGTKNGECHRANEIDGRQDPKDDGPLRVGLIMVCDVADHEGAKETAYRAEGVGDAKYGPGEIGRDVETVPEITGRYAAVYRQSDGKYGDRRRAIATIIRLDHHEDAGS